MALLFPHFSHHHNCEPWDILVEIDSVRDLLGELSVERTKADAFLNALPELHQALRHDARALHNSDPAAESLDEVILAYPGFFAVCIYRMANRLYHEGVALIPRLLAEHAHRLTGIDIHPAATIGRGLAIDHGTGLVIGASAEIGNNVRLYQGVTLGALLVEKRQSGRKRHPTIEDHVVVYANATILGGDTVIGHDSVIGGNAWITESVPPFSVVGRNSEVRPRKAGADAELEFNI